MAEQLQSQAFELPKDKEQENQQIVPPLPVQQAQNFSNQPALQQPPLPAAFNQQNVSARQARAEPSQARIEQNTQSSAFTSLSKPSNQKKYSLKPDQVGIDPFQAAASQILGQQSDKPSPLSEEALDHLVSEAIQMSQAEPASQQPAANTEKAQVASQIEAPPIPAQNQVIEPPASQNAQRQVYQSALSRQQTQLARKQQQAQRQPQSAISSQPLSNGAGTAYSNPLGQPPQNQPERPQWEYPIQGQALIAKGAERRYGNKQQLQDQINGREKVGSHLVPQSTLALQESRQQSVSAQKIIYQTGDQDFVNMDFRDNQGDPVKNQKGFENVSRNGAQAPFAINEWRGGNRGVRYSQAGTNIHTANNSHMDMTYDPDQSMSIADSASQVSEAFDSEGSQVSVKSKKDTSMGWYTYLKVVNIMLYVATLCLAFGYYSSTKYTSKFTYYLFGALFVTRPVLIAVYSLAVIAIEFAKRSAKPSKSSKKSKSGDESDFSQSQDEGQSESDAYQDVMNSSYFSNQQKNKVQPVGRQYEGGSFDESDMSETPTPTPAPKRQLTIKEQKKYEKKRTTQMTEFLMLLPLMMYTGSGRHLITLDGKRNLVKIAQVQEMFLHTIPVGALIWYNNTTEIEYDSTLDTLIKLVFIASLLLNFVEIVAFYVLKAQGENLEINKVTGKPRIANNIIKLFAAASILACIIAIVVGMTAFTEQSCKTSWALDPDNDYLCKECTEIYGSTCTACNSTTCTEGAVESTGDTEAALAEAEAASTEVAETNVTEAGTDLAEAETESTEAGTESTEAGTETVEAESLPEGVTQVTSVQTQEVEMCDEESGECETVTEEVEVQQQFVTVTSQSQTCSTDETTGLQLCQNVSSQQVVPIEEATQQCETNAETGEETCAFVLTADIPIECPETGCPECEEGYYLGADIECHLCSEALFGCGTCSSQYECTECSYYGLTLGESGTCVCDTSLDENLLADSETGYCSCPDGYFLDLYTTTCLSCYDLIENCDSCSQVSWNTQLPLDAFLLAGSSDPIYVTCDYCYETSMYVEIDLDTSIEVDGLDYSAPDYANLPSGAQALNSPQCTTCISTWNWCEECGTYGTECTTCQSDRFVVAASGHCQCDTTNQEFMVLDEASGLCTCETGYFMNQNFGCSTCSYQVPGCFSCSEVSWNSGIPLDVDRLNGPGSDPAYLTCDRCETDDYFVEINIDESSGVDTSSVDYASLPDYAYTTEPISCSQCQTRYDGCSQCGTYGEECTGCFPTHTLQTVDVEPCTRCDYFMANCLKCYDSISCYQTKPSLLI